MTFRRPCSDFTDMLWRLTNCRIIIIIKVPARPGRVGAYGRVRLEVSRSQHAPHLAAGRPRDGKRTGADDR